MIICDVTFIYHSLHQAYLGMRRRGGGGNGGSKTISATPRQLESLIRIAQV